MLFRSVSQSRYLGVTGMGAPLGLPLGLKAVWSSDVITISGTPAESGTFSYTIPLMGSCGNISAKGTIVVIKINNAGLASTSPIVCNGTELPTLTHTTGGATGIGAATGLPLGVTANWANNIIRITGTPQVSGIYNYRIPLTGGCGETEATGTIQVKESIS